MTESAFARRYSAPPRQPPAILAPNRVRRFYAGGERIDALRGGAPHPGSPEEWVGSTTSTFGQTREGLSALADGTLVRDAIAVQPEAFLGAEHLRRFGADPALLVKLLDTGERLAVHFHPGRAFAREHLGLSYGKTEAWLIIDAEPGAVVHLGLTEPVSAETVSGWVASQDAEAMLAALHERPARPGDVFMVPAGTLHAIGAGILMVELQEPTDLSVLLEFERFGIDDGSETLGLGWERVLTAVDRTAAAAPEDARASTGLAELLPPEAAPYFRAQRVICDGEPVTLEPSFAILIVLDGPLVLGSDLELPRGTTVLVPHGAGETTLSGHGAAIRCLPPSPDAGEPRW